MTELKGTEKKPKEEKEIEVKINDRMRILMTIDSSMDANGFMEMMNHVKNIVKQNVPDYSGVGTRVRSTPSVVQEKMELVTKYLKEGLTINEITVKMGCSRTWVLDLIRRAKAKGLIK